MATKVEPTPWQIRHPNAAGIDVGSSQHYVAVPADRCEKPVRSFGSCTAELEELADWLSQCGVDTVAMEATGVYWVGLYELLGERGFKVCLTDARRTQNVSGRKSDVLDCQWLQQLMTYGLLISAFIPDESISQIRTVVREQDRLKTQRGQRVQLMQKALTLMNVQLATVLSEVDGKSGLAILRAIVDGERDPQSLAALCDYRVHASTEEVARSLQGTWRSEHLLCLSNGLQEYDFLSGLMKRCDVELEQLLKAVERFGGELPKGKKRGGKNAPHFDLRSALYRWAGVDLTRIGGIDVQTALVALTEVGWDLSRFKNVKHFTSWLCLCPGTRITGGKRIGGSTRRTRNRLTVALKLAAQGLSRSRCSLGAYYRSKAQRMNTSKAITATAHKLARLIFAMLTKGEEYVARSEAEYEQEHRARGLRALQNKAAQFGMRLEPAV
jgi:transposase